MQKFIFFLFFTVGMLAIPVAYKRLTCGFKIAKMELAVPFCSSWDIANDADVSEILSQNFTYLNRGAQCYVFTSEDEKYVIKFFRFDRKMKRSLQKNLDELFTACILAYTKAKDETGVIYLHLNSTKGQLPILHLKGPLGQNLALKLDDYRFVIQKKVNAFQESLLDKNPEVVRKRLDSFVNLLQTRLDKGIYNSDPALVRNFGFLGEKAIEIDFGNYTDKTASREEEFAQYTNTLKNWLKKNAPEFVTYLEQRVSDATSH